MRKVVGVLLLVLGIPILVAGIIAAVYVGPDDTAQTGPHRLSTDGVAVVTTPQVIAYVGPTMHLTVQSTGDDPLFLGIGPQVDVESYLAGAKLREVSDLELPWTITSAQTGTSTEALAAPGEQQWWLKSSTGAGARTIVWPLPNGRYEIAALNADGSPGVTLNVTLGLEVGGAFYTTLAVAAFGLLLVLLGLLLLVWRRLRRRRDARQVEAPLAVPDAAAPVPTDGATVVTAVPVVAVPTDDAPTAVTIAPSLDDTSATYDTAVMQPAPAEPATDSEEWRPLFGSTSPERPTEGAPHTPEDQ